VGKSGGTDSAIWLGIPLKTRGQTVGAVVVQSYDNHDEYGEREKQILSFISGQIAVAIELMRYREKLEEIVRMRTNELLEEKKVQEILFEISQSLYGAGNLQDFLKTVQLKIGQLMDARNFYVALYDHEIEKYRFPIFIDEFDRADSHSPEDLHSSLTDYVRQRGPLLADRHVHQELIKKGEVSGVVGTDSLVWLGVPLLVPGKSEAIGVMAVQSYEDRRRYSDKEKKILMNISTTVALAIDRISLVTDLFHHFNNSVTSIRGQAEILLRASDKESAWLDRLNRYFQRVTEPGSKAGEAQSRAELNEIIRFLWQAKANKEKRIGKIIEGIDDAARRMNQVFGPLMLGARKENR